MHQQLSKKTSKLIGITVQLHKMRTKCTADTNGHKYRMECPIQLFE